MLNNQTAGVDLQDIMASIVRARNLLSVFRDFYNEDLFKALNGGQSWQIEDVTDRHEQFASVLLSADDLLEAQLSLLDSAVKSDLSLRKDEKHEHRDQQGTTN